MPHPTSSRRWRLLALALLIALVVPTGCSLTPQAPVQIQVSGLRDNPELSGMSSFAIVVTGAGLSPTVAASGLGGRNVECLKLDGQVSYSFTLAQLTAGVSLSIPLGNYRISIVGYADQTGSSPTIPALFAGSASLRSYLIAQGDFNTASSQLARLTSSYVKASATELVAACPRPASALYTLYTENNLLRALQKVNGVWSNEPVSGVVETTVGNLAIDALGFKHVMYVLNQAAPTRLFYSENTTGTFVPTSLTPGYAASYPTDIAVASNGTLYALEIDEFATQNLKLLSRTGTGPFTTFDGSVISSISMSFADVRIVSADNRLLVTGSTGGTPQYLIVRVRDELGAWSAPQTISTAGSFNCAAAAAGAQGVFDGTGTAHILYSCYSAAGVGRVGYANNRAGTFTTYDISQSTSSGLGAISLSSDGTYLHGLSTSGGTVFYQRGSLATGVFSPPESFFTAGNILGHSIASVSTSDTRALVLSLTAGAAWISELSLAGSTWTDLGPVITGTNVFLLNRRLVAK